MDQELVVLAQDLARLEKHMREVRKSVRQTQDRLGRSLGTYTLAAGEQWDAMDVIAFLRLAVGVKASSDIHITVTAPQLGADQGDQHEQAQDVRRGRENEGTAGRNGHDRRPGVSPGAAHTGRPA